MTLGGSSVQMFFLKWLDGSGFIASILKWCRWPGVCFRYRQQLVLVYTGHVYKILYVPVSCSLMQKVIKASSSTLTAIIKKIQTVFRKNLLQVCLITSADGLAFFSMPLNKGFRRWTEGFRWCLSLSFLHNCYDLYFKGHFNFYMLNWRFRKRSLGEVVN